MEFCHGDSCLSHLFLYKKSKEKKLNEMKRKDIDQAKNLVRNRECGGEPNRHSIIRT